MTGLLEDPPVRPDEVCARDGCEKRIPVQDDPFCSTGCCRDWHGCPAPTNNPDGRRTKSYTSE